MLPAQVSAAAVEADPSDDMIRIVGGGRGMLGPTHEPRRSTAAQADFQNALGSASRFTATPLTAMTTFSWGEERGDLKPGSLDQTPIP